MADCLALAAMCKRHLRQHPGLLGIHSAKFFQLAGAFKSQMKVAQDVADDFVTMGDVTSALQILESDVVPLLNRFAFDGEMMDVRGQYAVVLAYNGRVADARSEINAIKPYVEVLPQEYQLGFLNQQRIVEEIARAVVGRGRERTQMPGTAEPTTFSRPVRTKKIGRNAPCPCGSGKKFKRCCGAVS